MKHKFLLLFLLYSFGLFAQNEVYFLKDTSHTFTKENIHLGNFHSIEKQVLEKHSDDFYWFKIPKSNDKEEYNFTIKSIRVKNPVAYQNHKKIKLLPKERYTTFKFTRNDDVYIKVSSDYVNYFPFELKKELEYNYSEKINFIINSFYYGFAFLVIFYTFFYYYFFKDRTFLYYALFLLSLTFTFFILDGMLDFFDFSKSIISNLILFNYVFLAYVSSKFVNSFLLLNENLPELKKFTYSIGVFIIIVAFTNYLTSNHNFFIALNVLVLLLLFIYWVVAVSFYKKNIYTKILVFAFVILIFSGIDSFVLKNFGISVLKSDSMNIKIGGLIQIVVLWSAVFFREKTLRASFASMKKEIIKYSTVINKNEESIGASIKENLKKLSLREKEIFDLITAGKSNKEVSNELHISVNTVKFHIKNIYEKLNIKSRKEVYNFTSD